ncbi:hypothetical protein SESBI_21451 [Sesbania bispinosa]|nr:hypothetical protein SESBI_21451 [Sesbania bispinosa]
MGALKAPGPNDDSLLFARAEVQEIYQITKILNAFSKASGQRINLTKSGAIFRRGVPQDKRRLISNLLQVQEWSNPGRYLGLSAEWGK